MNVNLEWQKFTGTYEKTWYDIKLHDGSVVESVYPNSGFFYSGVVTKTVEFAEVASYKVGKHPLDL